MNGWPRLAIAPSAAAFDAAAGEAIAETIRAAVARHGRAAVGLAGGRTPVGAYRTLAAAPDLDWRRVELLLGDERAVPAGDPLRNDRLVEAALLSRLPTVPAAFHRYPDQIDEQADLDAIADAYAARLPAALDALVLGVGEDGHVASLFPGSPAVRERSRRVVPVGDSPKPPPVRWTITPPVIEGAAEVFVLARGRAKAAAVRRALCGAPDPAACPACLARAARWILDRAAAADLPFG